ncbi:DNA-binding transcriptional regulator YiaG [Litorivivens lipolytica]|uniref:DNA-binding transcriptional regulator YiaG n=1 Tax=Litorivivens lipolytica TaxID=1524264 RepID=A0A7W4W5H7_9GAMM|nr:hypothetical protein [Litorivivens lipolytica]MBB3047473.1 DNA-binding transcriptional regulator YiaG [Litorivivens lipolytica]
MDGNIESLIAEVRNTESQYGEISLSEVRRLHRQTVMAILKKHSSLSGSEVRFLRERMSYSRQRVADAVGISRDTLESWEQDSAFIIPAIDIRLRLLCAEHLGVILDVRSVLCALVRQSRREAEMERISRASASSTRQAPRASASLSR